MLVPKWPAGCGRGATPTCVDSDLPHGLVTPVSAKLGAVPFLQAVEEAHPVGEIVVVTDNLSSHNSVATRTWLESHPRIRQVFILTVLWWVVEPAGGLVVSLPQGGFGGTVLRRPGRDRGRRGPGHRTAQRSGQALGLGPATTTASPATPEVHLPP